jgi:glycosyltransferase involved in cell wall biosynthesis
MRVLIVSDMFPRGDNPLSGVFVLDQVKALLRNGLDITVICPTPRFIAHLGLVGNFKRGTALKSNRRHISGVEVASIPYLNLPLSVGIQLTIASMYLALLGSIKREFDKRRVDIIHAHRVFPTGYVSMLISRKLGVPCAISAHGSDVHTHPFNNTKIGMLTRRTIEGADQLIAVSYSLALQIEGLRRPKNPVLVVHNEIDTTLFKPIPERAALRRSLGLPEQGLAICYAGRISQEKGILELVSAFDSLRASNPDVWLLLIGDGPLRREIQNYGAIRQNRVFCVGPVLHDDMAKWLNAADIFVMSSHKEGASMVVLEAMACGLPIIATSVGIVPELEIENSCGFVIPANQAAPLTAALEQLIQNEELRLRMGFSARNIITSKYEPANTLSRLPQIYRRLTSHPLGDF